MISKHESSFEPPIDLLVLAELCREMGGAESTDFRDAIASYLRDTAHRMGALEEAWTRQLSESIRYEAHALKGTSGFFGARKTQDLCLQIELLAKADDFGSVGQRLADLKKELQRVRQALDAEGIHGSA